MRLAVFQRGVRDVYEVDGTLTLGGDWNGVAPEGGGIWRARFWDHGQTKQMRIIGGSLPTRIDGRAVDDHMTTLYPGMEIAFGAVRILVEYDAPLAPTPPLSEVERELLQQIAAGDDAAAVVLADHWGDARGAFVVAQRAGLEGEPHFTWLASLRTAGFAVSFARGFARPLAVHEGEPLLLDGDAARIAPRRYLLGEHLPQAARAWQAVAAGPSGELGRFVVKVPHDLRDDSLVQEGRLLARLDHPNLARYVEPVEHRFGMGFAMRWAGERFPWPIGEARAIAIGLQLVEALRHLAERRVVHNAIVPASLVLDGDRVTLVGFNDATALDAPGLGVARVQFSPEQQRNEHTTPASDRYQVARLLLLLADQVPGDDTPLARIARRALVDDPAQRPSLDDIASSLADASSRAGNSSRP